MKTSIITLLLSACAIGMNAQDLKQQGTSIEQIVPEGWEHEEAQGDLNKDGIKDLVVLAKPNFKENMMTRDDGYEYNFNPYILAIYFGQAEGGFLLWKQYDTLFQPDDEYTSLDVDIEITERGTMKIDTDPFASAGSWANDLTSYTYRYQDGDFYQIGKETTTLIRNTGEMTTVSENYLTWKQQTIKDNAFEEGEKKETWTKLTKKPLEKLGDNEL
ncbi:MAG: hypothetical protein IKP41_05380 [Bacteroidaceae bacterium]|nr:hypothetical protein [Bacteroidaceae bacterium]